jgi:hypothetical protein
LELVLHIATGFIPTTEHNGLVDSEIDIMAEIVLGTKGRYALLPGLKSGVLALRLR